MSSAKLKIIQKMQPRAQLLGRMAERSFPRMGRERSQFTTDIAAEEPEVRDHVGMAVVGIVVDDER